METGDHPRPGGGRVQQQEPGPAPEVLRYDLVLLDVGGTLLGFHDREPFRAFLEAAGLPAGEEEARAFHVRFVEAIVAERDTAEGLGADEEGLFRWWLGIFNRTWPDRPDLAAEMQRWFRNGRFDRVFADVVPALDALRALGIRMGVVSNFVTYLEALLSHARLRDYFDFVVVSALVGVAKPDPRIFDYAVPPGQPRDRVLYVGDHYGDDVIGARAAGIDVVLVDRRDRLSDLPCARIRSLTDLPRYIGPPPPDRRAVLLDMDGVVLDSMPAHLRTWQAVLAPLGIQLTAADLYPLEGVPTEQTAQLFVKKLLGQTLSDEKARRMAQAKRALFIREFEPAFIPGIVPLIHDLRGRGHRLALVTGSARSVVEAVLGPPGVLSLFDVVITGTDVVRGKPAPEPYQVAAARLGLSPAECLVVENAPLGVQSAKAAGMVCAVVETGLPADQLPGADHIFPNVSALREWLVSDA